MRIALFSGNYNYLREGANQALNRLVAYLETNAGCVVRVYSPTSETPAFEPAGTLVPVPSVAMPVRSEFRLALSLPRAIAQDVRAFAPDLVHVSTPDILDTRAQTLAKRMNVPIVASMHTRFEAYLEYYGLDWLRPLAEAHLRRFYRRSDHVLAPTPALVTEMKRIRGDDHASVWARGVDRTLFSPARRDPEWRISVGLAEEEIVLLFFGRLVLEKGVGIFIDVVRRLQSQGARVRALIVGSGPAREAFDALPGAILTGHLDGPDLARAVASADIMLAPSRTETFGNVVLEAMASGLPVVSADATSARAMLVDGRTGLFCPSLDPEAYAETVMRLIAAPGLRQQIAAAARQASEAYSWDAASEAVVRAYASVRRRRGAGRVPNRG